MLADTRQEVRRLSRLVDDLLLLAEIGERVNPERAPVRLDLVIDAVVARLSAADAARVEVDHEPVIVAGDEERLSQVVGNLLHNALRYASSALERSASSWSATARTRV